MAFNFSSLLNLSPTRTGKNPQPAFDQPSPFRKRRQGLANSLFQSGTKPRLFPETPTMDSAGGQQAAGQTQPSSPVTMNFNLGGAGVPTPSLGGDPRGALPFFTGQGANPFLSGDQLGIMGGISQGQFELPETGDFADASVLLGQAAQGSNTLANPDFLNFMLSGRLPSLQSLNPLMLRSLSPSILQGIMGQFSSANQEGVGDININDIFGPGGFIQRTTPTGL